MKRTLNSLARYSVFAAFLLTGCASVPIARLPGGSEFVLSGPLEDAFKAITAHQVNAITLSDRLIIYGSEDLVTANRQCHERRHSAQASRIADALIAAEAIDDTPRARMLSWLAVYGQEFLQHGYNSRFERDARDGCKDVK